MIQNDDILVVTGGNGFLGKHILENIPMHVQNSKVYSSNAENTNQPTRLSEVRLLDITYPKVETIEETLTVSVKGNQIDTIHVKKVHLDILDYESLRSALQNATIVLHCASIITHPSVDYLYQVNVQGTENVIRACVAEKVPYLIYTSTIDVIIGFELGHFEFDEDSPYPTVPLFTNYGNSKKLAELAVIKANGTPIRHNYNKQGYLKTLCLRPSAIYGPYDIYFVTQSIQRGIRGSEPYIWFRRGQKFCFPRLNIGRAKYQAVYIGNVAWAHLKAIDALRTNPQTSGKVYFITDDTPKQSVYQLVQPYFKAKDIKLYPRNIPHILMSIATKLLNFMFRHIPHLQRYFPLSLSALVYLYSSHIIRGDARSRGELGYEPLYTYEESVANSLEYYKSIE